MSFVFRGKYIILQPGQHPEKYKSTRRLVLMFRSQYRKITNEVSYNVDENPKEEGKIQERIIEYI